jgi:hypothetical protein
MTRVWLGSNRVGSAIALRRSSGSSFGSSLGSM